MVKGHFVRTASHATSNDENRLDEQSRSGSFAPNLLPWCIALLLHIGVGVVIFQVWVGSWSSENHTDANDWVPTVTFLPSSEPSRWVRVHGHGDRIDGRGIICVFPKGRSEDWGTRVKPKPVKHDDLWNVSPRVTDQAMRPFESDVFAPSWQRELKGGPWVNGVIKCTFGCQSARARDVVFVIDASASNLHAFPFIIDELKRGVVKLKHTDRFVVLFATGAGVLEAMANDELERGMKEAVDHYQRAFLEWMDAGHVVPQGRGDLLLALKHGLRYEPDMLFLLTDNITGRGRHEVSQFEVLTTISKLNTGKSKIHTLQFLRRDPLADVPGLKPTLKLISEQSGGRYRFVSRREMGMGG